MEAKQTWIPACVHGLVIDVRHGVSMRAPQGLAVFVQMGEAAQPP